MHSELIIILALLLMGVFVAGAFALDLPILSRRARLTSVKSHMRNIVAAQRTAAPMTAAQKRKLTVYDVVNESTVHKTLDSKLTLAKRLKYAQWKITPLMFRVGIVLVSLLAFAVASIKFGIVIRVASLLTGPLFMGWLLNFFMDRRFYRFDRDYAPFLLSLVGLLKTGMNTMQAIEAAAGGLDDSSLVREEALLMMERLRFGVSEDKSIGSFGEDVFHPEIELFVQALLLSRRVGGNLSDTLDRLAKQVRKRQFFRASAHAAVGLQRGSIYFIIGILVALEIYLLVIYPEAVTGGIKDEVGWQVWQIGLILIALGIYWVRQVTKIRI